MNIITNLYSSKKNNVQTGDIYIYKPFYNDFIKFLSVK